VPDSITPSRPRAAAAAADLISTPVNPNLQRRAAGAAPSPVSPQGLQANAARLAGQAFGANAGQAAAQAGPDLRRRAAAPEVPAPFQAQQPVPQMQAEAVGDYLGPATAATVNGMMVLPDRAVRMVRRGAVVIEQAGESLMRTAQVHLDAAERRGQRFIENNPELVAAGQRAAWNVIATVSPAVFWAGAALTAAGVAAVPIAYPLGAVAYLAGHPSASNLLNFPHGAFIFGMQLGLVGHKGMDDAEHFGHTHGPIANALNLNPLRAANNALVGVKTKLKNKQEAVILAAGDFFPSVSATRTYIEIKAKYREYLKANLFEALGLADERMFLQNELEHPNTEAGRRLELLEELDFGEIWFKPSEYEQVMGEIGLETTGRSNSLRPRGIDIPPFLNGKTPSTDPAELLEQLKQFVRSWPTEPTVSGTRS
jgi:hypothetical protein